MKDTDRVRFATLAEHYHNEADACRRAAIDMDVVHESSTFMK
jgi:hypothetical protein